MKKFKLFLLFLGGCASTQPSEESRLPWAKPASWETKKDISTSTSFHKEYRSADFR